LNKFTYRGISELLAKIHSRDIRFSLNIVNIFPYGFNSFTSTENVYLSTNLAITEELNNVRKIAEKLGINVSIPKPWNESNLSKNPCMMFWQKVQIMPSKKLPKDKWSGNAIPQQCNAVVSGDLYSVGNILDHEDFMDFWNNKKYIEIRKRILKGNLPDKACQQCYTGFHGSFKKKDIMDTIKTKFFGLIFK